MCSDIYFNVACTLIPRKYVRVKPYFNTHVLYGHGKGCSELNRYHLLIFHLCLCPYQRTYQFQYHLWYQPFQSQSIRLTLEAPLRYVFQFPKNLSILVRSSNLGIIHILHQHNFGLFLTPPLGLDRTGPMCFLTRQDRTPKFAGQVLLATESGLIFLNIFLKKTFFGISSYF